MMLMTSPNVDEALAAHAPAGFDWTRLARERRSQRRCTTEPIDIQALERVLTAATSAPSAHNRQPWRFAIIDKPRDKLGLATVMGRRLRADRLRHGDDPEFVEADVARSAARLTQAPCLVLVCLTMADMDIYPDPARRQAEYVMAVQSVAMATQNLLLAACGEGLGACVMCAPLFCPDEVVGALRLPGDWQPQSLITLGRPAAAARERGRKPLREVSLRVTGLDGETAERER